MGWLPLVQLGCLVALGLVPFLCGLLPVALRRAASPGCAQRWRSLGSCAAGGVFLATCLLEMLPESLADLREELRRHSLAVDFPAAELVVALGFLLVLVTEHVALDCSEPRRDAPRPDDAEAAALLPPSPQEEEEEEEAAPQQQQQQQQQAGGSRRPSARFRSAALALALSLHSVFEGLAVGLQDTPGRALHLAGAILLHKSAVAAGLGLVLLQSRLPLRWLAAALGAFALTSPLGVALGMAVSHCARPGSTAARSLLQGLAAGTFMYVTFLEILPQELSAPARRLPKVLAVLLGFSAMAGLRLLA